MMPVIGVSPAGGLRRKWALTMARNSVGVVRPGTSAAATTGGTARTIASPGRSGTGGAFRRLGVERGQQQRPDQPVIERPFAIEHVADGRAWRSVQQAQNGQIIARTRSRHAAIAVEYPPRDAAIIGAQGPALMGRETDKGKTRGRRADQTIAGADRIEVAERRPVTGQQEMVAVIDRNSEDGVKIRAAAPARLVSRLV